MSLRLEQQQEDEDWTERIASQKEESESTGQEKTGKTIAQKPRQN